VLYCEADACKGKKHPIKPNIVFFGESLPSDFLKLLYPGELSKCDLLIVMGTALAVAPFNHLVHQVPASCLKVLMNLTNTKETGGVDFTEKDTNKLFLQGKCDDLVAQLCQELGWTDDFEHVLPDYHAGKHIPAKL
jgi:NAD-dependent deacetylase sirtuin 2